MKSILYIEIFLDIQEVKDKSKVPTCNLAEVVHASWLAGKGFQGSMKLYEASVSDIAQALLQIEKSYAFTKGRYHGSGPFAEKLANRINFATECRENGC